MSKLSLFSQVGSLIYNFRWENKKSQALIEWKLSQVKDSIIHKPYHLVKGKFSKIIICNNCIPRYDITKMNDTEQTFT